VDQLTEQRRRSDSAGIGEPELPGSIIKPQRRWILDDANRSRLLLCKEQVNFARCGKLNQSAMQATPTNALTIGTLLGDAERVLAEGPFPGKAHRDAEALLLHLLGKDGPAKNLAWLIAHRDDSVPTGVANATHALVGRRAAGEPIQYITGETEFYRLPILVNRDVLIPRPETELLVEKAVEQAPRFGRPRMLDVGTGSGAVALALAHEWPEAMVTATDISQAALVLARCNADRVGLAGRIRFLPGDLLDPVAGEKFELVVSNPPYVPERDRASLSVEVRDYEPAQALFAGEDGLAIYRRLIPAAFGALVSGGFVVLEIGYGQEQDVAQMLAGAGFDGIDFTNDLQGIARVASARRRPVR
jgi:release factor glutamine methyltransferase